MGQLKDTNTFAAIDLAAKIGLPLIILGLGTWIGQNRAAADTRAYEQRKSAEEHSSLLRIVADAVPRLASQNRDERLFMVKALKNYAVDGQLPKELTTCLSHVATNDPDKAVRDEATGTVEQVLAQTVEESTIQGDQQVPDKPTATPSANPQLKKAREELKAVVSGSPRVFIQVPSGSTAQIASAKQLASQLKTAGYIAPGIEQVGSGPDKFEIRYFYKQDEQQVQTLAQSLKSSGFANLSPVYVQGYENSTSIKPKQYEVWYPKP